MASPESPIGAMVPPSECAPPAENPCRYVLMDSEEYPATFTNGMWLPNVTPSNPSSNDDGPRVPRIATGFKVAPSVPESLP